VRRDFRFLILVYATDVRDTGCDHNDNRCHADAPLSNRLRLLRCVRPSSLSLVFPADYCRCHLRAHESLQVSNLAFSKTKQTDTTPTTPDRVEVAVHGPFVLQHPTGTTNDSGSSTVISTSEQMPHVIGDPLKLNLASESTYPPPTTSLSSSVSQV
jgi:hypothetical protein